MPPRPSASVADLYHGAGDPGIRRWPIEPYASAPRAGVIAWEAAGGSDVGGLRIDRYRLHHSDGLVIPVVHVHRPGATRGRVLLDLGLDGKIGVADWPEVRRLVESGDEVLSFDLRGTGETRMRYKAQSIDDPELAAMDEARAYASPISGVLANYVYNSLLTGRPYFLEMIEDAEIVARFARQKLGAHRLAVRGRGDAQALAEAVAEVLPEVERDSSPGAAVFDWSEAVERMRETWPIQYLLPGGADLRPSRRPGGE